MRLGWGAPLVCMAMVLVLVLVLGSPTEAEAQADPLHFTFNSGQTIQPYFEGWAHNPDGSFEMHFGYLNRNYVEELHVPVGANNRMSPDEPDKGQPTYFYPRVNRRVFSVTVPADWGDERLVWRVTIRDETYRAEGWLQPEWEISVDPMRAFFAAGDGAAENQAPTMSAIEAPTTTGVGESVMMSARVSDDGLPEPRRRGGGREQPPTFAPVDNGPTLPINVPQVQPTARKRPTRTSVGEVNVTWTVLRGPTGVSVEPREDSADGVAAVTATFSTAGEYLFRVQASDGPKSVTREIALTVR